MSEEKGMRSWSGTLANSILRRYEMPYGGIGHDVGHGDIKIRRWQ